MHFDIANLAFNIGQKDNNLVTVWLPIIVGASATLIGAFVGSYVSSQLTKHQKDISIDHQNSREINELLFLLDNVFNVLITSYTDNFNEFYISVKTNNLNISIETKDYLFLSKYSNQILPLLNLIKNNIYSLNFYISNVEHENKVPKKIIFNTLYYINCAGEKLLHIYKNNVLVNSTLFNTKRNNDEFEKLKIGNDEKTSLEIKYENINEWTKISPISIWTILKELIIFAIPCSFINREEENDL